MQRRSRSDSRARRRGGSGQCSGDVCGLQNHDRGGAEACIYFRRRYGRNRRLVGALSRRQVPTASWLLEIGPRANFAFWADTAHSGPRVFVLAPVHSCHASCHVPGPPVISKPFGGERRGPSRPKNYRKISRRHFIRYCKPEATANTIAFSEDVISVTRDGFDSQAGYRCFHRL